MLAETQLRRTTFRFSGNDRNQTRIFKLNSRNWSPALAFAGFLAGLASTGCTGEREKGAPTRLPTSDEIVRHLQAQAEILYADDLVDVRVTNVKISADRTLACGVVEGSDGKGGLFVSADDTPATLERSLGGPWMPAITRRQRELEAERSAQAETVCRRNGLIPDAESDAALRTKP